MLRYLIPCLLISVGVTLAADDGAPEENAVQNAEPPNECNMQYRARLKGHPFHFFDVVRLFLENFLMSSKGLLQFFDIRQQNGY